MARNQSPQGREVLVGWDGNSKPIVDLEEPCGCRWNRGGSARLRVCTACLSAAIRRDALAAQQ